MQVLLLIYAGCCLAGVSSFIFAEDGFGQMSSVVATDGPSSQQTMDPLCGTVDTNFVSGYISFRRVDNDDLGAWILKFCEFEQPVHLDEIQWLAMETSSAFWQGRADWAIWDQKTVEQGCADNQSALHLEVDVRNRREFVQNTFNGDIYRYEADVDVTLKPGGYFFGMRNVVSERGLSFIMTSDCQGDRPGYFQSKLFGLPCAVPGRGPFGDDYCFTMAVFGDELVECEKVRRIKARARCEKEKVVAAVRSRLPEGMVLTLTLDGDRPQEVVIDENGKARARWRDATGGEICSTECPDRCATPDPCK